MNMNKKEHWKTSEEYERDDTLSNRLVDTFISFVPNFEGFRTYGPTLDATVIETLQAFENACPSDRRPAEWARREGHDAQLVSRSSSNMSLAAGAQTLRNYLGPTPDATVLESASAISILQGISKSSSSEFDEKPSCHSSKISTCLSQKGSVMLEGVRSLLSSKGSEHSRKSTSSKHVTMNPIQAAWDIFDSKECHSRLPPKRSFSQSANNDHLQELTPIFNQQQSCCLHYDDEEPPDDPFQQGDAPCPKTTPKMVRTLWGITRINIFEDCSKTYEIMGITPYRPQHVPEQIDGIFVVGPPSKDKRLVT